MLFSFLKSKANRLLLLLPSSLLGLVFVILLSGAYSDYEPLNSSIDYVKTEEFTGEWFIISNIPYFAEKNKVASKANYILNEKNEIDDIFISQEGSFDAPVDIIKGSVKSLNQSNTQWQSTFYWLIKFDFEILHMNDKHNTMLLGHKSRDYGWIMARTPTIPDSAIISALQVFADNNYNISKFRIVPQTPKQLSLMNTKITEIYDLSAVNQ